MIRRFAICAALTMALTTMPAFAQTKPAFEVATVKPAAPLDTAKMLAAIPAGQPPKLGAHVTAERAEYTYMALKDLIALAYGVKASQISGPDWLASQRFDILAKLPEGASKDDAPEMLKMLLMDRFKLAVHRDSAEHPVLALVVGKGGPKLHESAEAPAAFDESTPLQPGEMALDTPDGPVRISVGKDGARTLYLGARGVATVRLDQTTQTMHLDGKMVTMTGFADILSQFSQMLDGSSRPFVDMTGLKGHYEIAIDFSSAELMSIARARGIDVSAAPGEGNPAGSAAVTPEPGGLSLVAAVEALGLKLESRKAMVTEINVDHVEKVPTGN